MATLFALEMVSIPPAPLTTGYIAGEAPDGIVTLNNVPGAAVLDLLRRADRTWLRRELSRGDGTYRFHAVPLGHEYDIIGQDPTGELADVIVGRVQPYAPPQITTASLAFDEGEPASVVMASQYGTGPMTWSIDDNPPGLLLNSAGEWTGAATTPGSYPVEITVTDVYGESATRAYTITVT